MILEQYYLGCLAHASYLIADTDAGVAAVVDPVHRGRHRPGHDVVVPYMSSSWRRDACSRLWTSAANRVNSS